MTLRGFVHWLSRLAIMILLLLVAAILVLSYAPHVARSVLAWGGKKIEKGSALLAPPLVAERPSTDCAWLDQNWSDADRAWFHNASQGTATFPVPYAWFKELERPEFSPFEPLVARGRISDPEYLARLGFMAPRDCDPKPAKQSEKPEGYGTLPVGFAILNSGADPTTGKPFEDALGLTCAACHTGNILYKGMELRIDGSQAMINLENLERILGLSICYTSKFPWRTYRFLNAVTANGTKGDVKNDLTATCEYEVEGKVYAERAILARQHAAHVEEGFGRLDALNRIGNQVFHENLADPQNREKPALDLAKGGLSQAALDANFAAHTAPVSFPPIWDVPHFSWAQYDASILNPNIRNIGEAMGVAAKINMTNPDDPSRPLFSSTVDVSAIARIEDMLRGSRHGQAIPTEFDGLHAPRWKDAAEKLKKMKVWDPNDKSWDEANSEVINAGRVLYKELCFECHRAPHRDPQISPHEPDSFWMESNADQIDSLPEDKNWVRIGNEWLFNVVQKPAAQMGTDPEQARVLTERRVNLPTYLRMDPQTEVLDGCGIKGDASLKKAYVVNLMAAVRRTENQWLADAKGRNEPIPDLGEIPNCPNPKVFSPTVPAADSYADRGAKGVSNVSFLAVPRYRARPLNGVWATAPYLHNGSVPTLDYLLQPQDARPKVFCVGPVQFDPKKVGLTVSDEMLTELDKALEDGVFSNEDVETMRCESGLSRFDTLQRGNSNRGHSFEGPADSLRPAGVIGRGLNDEERAALIEYLKTL